MGRKFIIKDSDFSEESEYIPYENIGALVGVSSNGAVIDTGIGYQDGMSIEVIAGMKNTFSGTGNVAAFLTGEKFSFDNSNGVAVSLFPADAPIAKLSLAYKGKYKSGYGAEFNKEFTIYVKPDSYVYNGTETNFTTSREYIGSDEQLKLFASNFDSGCIFVKSVKVYNNEGEILHNLVSARRKEDGVILFWDKITDDVYLPNKGDLVFADF